MKEGIAQGHREEFMGGGLIRSLGGWDERVLGEIEIMKDVSNSIPNSYSVLVKKRFVII